MAGGRGQAEIRTSNPVINIGETISLIPKTDNISKKERRGLDDGE